MFWLKNRPGPSQRNSGLTLVEVMIAVFVVAVGVLGAISALWFGIRSERYSERRTTGVFVARELLNLIRARNLPFIPATFPPVGDPINDGSYDNDSDDGGAQRELNAPPFENDFSGSENFKRRIEMKRLSTNSNSHLSKIAAVKVTVFWIEGASEKKVTLWAFHRKPD